MRQKRDGWLFNFEQGMLIRRDWVMVEREKGGGYFIFGI